jgi:hypothetical protein
VITKFEFELQWIFLQIIVEIEKPLSCSSFSLWFFIAFVRVSIFFGKGKQKGMIVYKRTYRSLSRSSNHYLPRHWWCSLFIFFLTKANSIYFIT